MSEVKHSFKNSLLDENCCIKDPAMLPSVSARSPRTPIAVIIVKDNEDSSINESNQDKSNKPLESNLS